jgi:hypothetical protein
LRAMKGPNGNIHQCRDSLGESVKPIASAANRRERRETLGPESPQIPCAKPAMLKPVR